METVEKIIGKKTYIIDDEITDLGKKVIANEAVSLDTNIKDVNITFMKVFPNINPTTAGQCVKSSKLLKFFSDSDIVIQMSGNLWDSLPEEIQYVLMLHELKHVGTKYDKKGNTVIGLMPHNVQDFYDIIKKYGVDWIVSLKSSVAGVEGFENGEEEKIKI